jgi:hypothetical protein
MRRLARLLTRALWLVVLLAVALVAVVAARIVLHARIDDRRASDTIVVLGASQSDGRPQAYRSARLALARQRNA